MRSRVYSPFQSRFGDIFIRASSHHHQAFASGMPKTVTSQKDSNKNHTSITASIASQSRARRSAVATAKKNRGKPRKKLSHQQATQTRDLLDAEFRDLRVKVSFYPLCCIICIWR